MNKENIIIYQSKSGKIEFRGDFDKDTIWGTQQQIADLFDVQKAAISKHLKHIYHEGELNKHTTVSKMETVQKEGVRQVTRTIEYYNLDAIVSIGYRVNSKQATQFRIWATRILRQHLIQGYSINKKQLVKNYDRFMKAIADVRILLPKESIVQAQDVLDLIHIFAGTWFSLDAYDRQALSKKGVTKKHVKFTAEELLIAIQKLKTELVSKKQATKIFAQERMSNSIEGIVGNILQRFDGKDVYPSLEEKAANLLYFVIKDHPFVDGNKRSAAFAFVWFLRKSALLRASLTPEALTALTLLIAESKAKDKEKMVGLVMLLLTK